jgi:hypothetical protein
MKIRYALWITAFLTFLNIHAPAATLYVSLASTNPVPPYADWSTAATNIQDAVDASTNGDLILVTNGVYATGGRTWYGQGGTNRVTLTNAVTLQSINGPAVTLIVGSQVAGAGTAVTNAVRCVLMGNNAVLSGFTLTNGEAGSAEVPVGGGGVVFGNRFGVGTVTNCVLIGNLVPDSYGGGAYFVALINCQIVGNHALYGGGAYGGTLNACTVSNNTALNGGGVYSATLTNCILCNNSAVNIGGGAAGSILANCTVVSNSANEGGGISYLTSPFTLANCVVYYNTAQIGANYYNLGTLNYCCTTPFPSGGFGNITNEPAFANLPNSDFHLQSISSCINSGNNAYVTSATDLDGNPRIVGGTVDIGAYEYQTPVSQISYAWLDQYGLPITAGIDTSDLDGTGFTVYQDWIAGLNPTNALSILAMLTPIPTNNPAGLVVSWQSVSNITYFLQSSTNLGMQPAFSTIQSNLVGQAGTTSYTDTSAVGSGPYFYRVGVQQ